MELSSTFTDKESGEEAYWSVRSQSDGVALALALKSGLDLDLLLDPDAAQQLGRAILVACDGL